MKAVIDTNVFVSGVFWKGPPSEVLLAWRRQKFQMLISAEILEEYRRVLHILNAGRLLVDVDGLLEIVIMNAVIIKPEKFKKGVCSDPDDDKFLEAAVGGKADYLVSGDKALLFLKEIMGTVILPPKKFLDAI
jgi:putative PIN family toxin of toxin-antitoxin system